MQHLIKPGALTHRIRFSAAGAELGAELSLPSGATGVVVVARVADTPLSHDIVMADRLDAAGIGTLLVDLLTPAEQTVDAQTSQLREDVELLASRLAGAVDWLLHEPACAGLPLGILASGSATAAALETAATRSDHVRAIVCRGGTPDRADNVLWCVHAPTLFIVGRRDLLAIARNRYVLERMTCARKLVLLEGVGHAFEGGAPEEAAGVATEWFSEHLTLGSKRFARTGPGPDAEEIC